MTRPPCKAFTKGDKPAVSDGDFSVSAAILLPLPVAAGAAVVMDPPVRLSLSPSDVADGAAAATAVREAETGVGLIVLGAVGVLVVSPFFNATLVVFVGVGGAEWTKGTAGGTAARGGEEDMRGTDAGGGRAVDALAEAAAVAVVVAVVGGTGAGMGSVNDAAAMPDDRAEPSAAAAPVG